MFPLRPPTRRPQVPSKAALRVLYQLAYISSGTALGIATLCAEERRRRTKVIQRIADNARLIRQSPRYVHAQASAQEKEDGEAWLPLVGEQERKRSKSVRVRREASDKADKGPELPSVVEREYGMSQRRDHKRVRRREDQMSSNGVAQQGNSALYQSPPTAKVRTSHDHIRTARDTMLRQSPPMTRKTGQPRDDATRDTKSQDNSAGAPKGASPTLQYSTEYAWRRDPFSHASFVSNRDAEARVTAGQIKKDTTAFFAWLPMNQFDSSVRETSGNLLYLALKDGSREDACELLRFYLSRRTSFEALQNILIAYHASPLSRTPEDRAHFLETFLSSKEFLQTKPNCRASFLTLVAVDVSAPQGLPPAFFAALEEIPAGLVDLDNVVEVRCLRLLLEDRLDGAINLIMVFKDHLQSPDKSLDRLITAGMRPNNVADMWRLLDWRRRHFTVSCQAWDNFIRLCVREDATSTLVKLASLMFKSNKGFLSLETLDHLRNESYASLARACAVSRRDVPRHVFIHVYRRLPKEMRSDVWNSSANAAVRELQAVWASTRNLQTVTDIALRHISILETTRLPSSAATLSIPTALIEIWLSAGGTDTAQLMLSKLHGKDDADSAISSLAAVIFAKRQDWVSLGKLLDLLCAKEKSSTHIGAKRHFNQVLALYAKEHNPDDVFSLATTLIERVGLKHNMAASNIVLQAFTEHQRLDLVDAWIEHAQARSARVRFDHHTVAGMLKAYYLKHRPSHVLMMWFCRALAKSCPSLAGDGAEYVTLVKEAIAYDIRKARGRLVTWKREAAKLRLDRLLDAQDTVDALNPGYRSGDHIIFPENRKSGLRASAKEGDVSETLQELPSISAIRQSTATQEKDDLEAQYRLPHNLTLQSAMDREAAVASPGAQAAPQETEDDRAQDRVNELLAQWDSEEADGDLLGQDAEDNSTPAQDSDRTSPGDQQLAPVDGTPASLASRKERDRTGPVPEHTGYSSVALKLRGTNVANLVQVERDMILALSDGQYGSVLDLYERALDAANLPASPLALEIAVEASLRLHKGNALPAEELMQRASDAGFNVSCAGGPLLIHQMSQMGSDDDWADRLVRMTTNYYRLNRENGWPVKHHVAVTAANVLINRHRPFEGLNLLTSITKSEWAEKKALPLAAMTVYLNGYAAIQGLAGVKWVVDTVLTTDMRIDAIFLRTLNLAIKSMVSNEGRVDAKSKALLRYLHEQCVVKHGQQRREGKLFGKKLVALLVRHGQAEEKRLVESRLVS